MKILLVNKFHYNRGGSETYYFALDELLRSKGHEVIHFAMKDEKNLESPTSGYFVSHVDLNEGGGLASKMRIVKNMFYSREAYAHMKALLEKERPDVVHLGLVHKQITYSILEAIREYDIPVVQSVHDLIFVCPCYTMLTNGQNCQSCIDAGVMSCIKKRCVKGSLAKSMLAVIENRYIAKKRYYEQIDAFVTECEFYRELLKKSGFTTSPIVNRTNFLPASKQRKLLTTGGDYMLYFGRFSPEKGILTLLAAYKAAQAGSRLVLVGGGHCEAQVKEFILANGLSERVELAGYVYGRQMEEILERARMVVVPSEWYENCPYTILEAMAKSRIVIASRIGGLPELVEDGVSGFLFEPGNVHDLAQKIKAVEALNAADYGAMCEHTYDRAEALFSPEEYYGWLMELYQGLMDRGNKHGI